MEGGTMTGRMKIAAAVSTVALVGGVVFIPGTSLGSSGSQQSIKAAVEDTSGNVLGSVRFTRHGDDVRVKAQLTGLTPGFHGFHVHAVGVCDPATGFTSAGGHFNPEGTVHGEHAGDMPSLLVAEDGSADLGFTTDRFTLESLRDADGSAVIVHANPDNFANIPDRYHSHEEDVFGPDSATRATGDAGSRAGCGVLAGPQN